MRICFHTHCFPENLAPRAMAALAENARRFGAVPHTDGTLAGAKKALSAAGIDKALICGVATNPRQQRNVNDFALDSAKADGFFIPAGAIHPGSENKKEEFARLFEAGVRGIKIHPDYCQTLITDDRYAEVFELACGYGMFVITHAGTDPVSPGCVHAPPQALKDVKRNFPQLKLIAAHMGGNAMSEEVLALLVGSDIYFDTSLSAFRKSERCSLLNILRRHDPERLLFGTDTPWSDASAEVEFVESSGLTPDALEKIFYRNALALLGTDKS
ncbi:MAG: amidohydrolase family protein [Clostridia bacterium]|nr:amidohydrolase family protein [Clostridia bacterium]